MLFVAVTPALAQDRAWLDGAYGNAAGCDFHKGGTRNDESMFLLTGSKIETYAMLCEILDIRKGAGAILATALCGHEGDDLVTAELVIIRNAAEPGQDRRRVTDAMGNEWGEAEPCR